MKHFNFLFLSTILLSLFMKVNAVENKAIQIPLKNWSNGHLTAYRLEFPDNLLGERGITDERTEKSFTMSSWVKVSNLSTDKTVIMGHAAKEHFVHNGSLVLNATADGSLLLLGNGSTSTLTEKVEQDVWTFLTIIYDNTAQTLTVYKDGKPAGETISLNKSLALFGDDPCIFFVGSTLFAGSCDEFQFYTKALTADEVKQSMTDPSTIEGLVGFYEFNEESSSTGIFNNSATGYKSSINAVFNQVTGTTGWEGDDHPFVINTPFSPTLEQARTFAVKFEQPSIGGSFEIQNEGTAISSGDQLAPGIVLTIVANPMDNYSVSSIRVNGISIQGTTFTLNSSTTVTVEFDLAYCEPNIRWTGANPHRITAIEVAGTTQEAPVLTAPTANYNHVYFKKTNEVIQATQKDELTITLTHKNITWMHFYIYVDYNHDGIFNETDELVSYTYHSDTGTDSKGVKRAEDYVPHGPNNEANMSVLPSFTIPETALLGQTRIRVKCDWNSKNPCGNPGEDASGKNTIDKTCGTIIDYAIDIKEKAIATYAISFEQPTIGGSFEVQKEGIPITTGDQIEEGTTLTIVATPEVDYMVKTIKVNDTPIEGSSFIVNGTSQVAVEFITTREYCTPIFSEGREVGHVTSATTTGALVNLNYKDTPSSGTYEAYNKVVDSSMIARRGQTITLTVNAINSRWGVERIFVDLNADHLFSSDEMVIKYGDTSDGNNNLDAVETTFIIPEDAPLGIIRMRVLMTDGDTSGDDSACGTYVDGGFYDFEMNIEEVKDMYTLTYTNETPDGGRVSVKSGAIKVNSGDPITAGSEVSIELIPETSTETASFTINGEDKMGELQNNKTTIVVDRDLIITASFKTVFYTFALNNTTPDSGSATAIDYDDSSKDITSGAEVMKGHYVQVKLTPVKNQKISSLKYNGEEIDWQNEAEDFGTYLEYSFEIVENAKIEVTFTGGSGIEDLNTNNIAAYYNAGTQTVNITENATAIIYDLVGNQILTTSEVITSVASLEAGCYLAKVNSAKGTTILKFIKK